MSENGGWFCSDLSFIVAVLEKKSIWWLCDVLSHGQRLYRRTAQDGVSKDICCWANNAAVEFTQHFAAHGSGFKTLV